MDDVVDDYISVITTKGNDNAAALMSLDD